MTDEPISRDCLRELRYVVQYRRKDGGGWNTMAAYDVERVAEKYCADCSAGELPWVYRWGKLAELEQ